MRPERPPLQPMLPSFHLRANDSRAVHRPGWRARQARRRPGRRRKSIRFQRYGFIIEHCQLLCDKEHTGGQQFHDIEARQEREDPLRSGSNQDAALNDRDTNRRCRCERRAAGSPNGNGMAPETQVAANGTADAPGFGNTPAAPEKKTRYSDRASIPKEKKAKGSQGRPLRAAASECRGSRGPAGAVRSAGPGRRYDQPQEGKADREDPAAGPAQEQAGG